MNQIELANLDIVRKYLKAVESMASGNELARFYTSDAIQIELPNRLNPSGGQSDLPTLLKRAVSVPSLLTYQRYVLKSEMARDHRVVIEADWEGSLAIPFGAVKAGSVLRAHFAMFFEIEDSKIRRQWNYDCFEPW